MDETIENQLSKDVSVGDVIWAKLYGSSWWPVQVVGENNVSESCKPKNKAHGEILTRLYGSYKYLYVDWVKIHSEFVIKLKENNGSYHEIISETLKQDLVNLKSGRSKNKESKAKATVSPKVSTKTTEARSRKRKQGNGQDISQHNPKSLQLSPNAQQTPNRNGNQKSLKSKNSSPASSTEKPQEPSSRKLKVMRSLALVAPSESPFQVKQMHSDKPV